METLTMVFFFAAMAFASFYVMHLLYTMSMAVIGSRLGIPVEIVQVGYGPKVAGFSFQGFPIVVKLIPLGGFTKFVSQDPSEPLVHESDRRSYFTERSPLVRILVLLSGPACIILLGVALLAISILSHSTQLVTCPNNESIITKCGVEGLKFDDTASTWIGQLQLLRQTAGEFVYRILTFQNLDNWGGPIAFIVTTGKISVCLPQAWFTCVGVLCIAQGLVNLLPIPVLNGHYILVALLEYITGIRLPERFTFWCSMFGLLICIIFMIRIFVIDVQWCFE